MRVERINNQSFDFKNGSNYYPNTELNRNKNNKKRDNKANISFKDILGESINKLR